MNELSTIRIFFSQDKIKLNLNFSNSELLKNIKIKINNSLKKKKFLKKKKVFLLQYLLKLYLHINVFNLSFKLLRNKFFFLLKNFINLLIKFLFKIKKKLMFNFKICLNYFFLIKKSLFLKKNKKINHYLYDLKNLYINFFLNKILFSNIKIFFTKLFKSKFFFFNINLIKDFLLTAQLIFKFIARQLKRNRTLMKVIYTLFNEIKKQSNLLGFKILTCGRFTRRERALFKVWIHKKLAFSNITVPLDYYAGNFKSKFGLCSVRIWLFHKFY